MTSTNIRTIGVPLSALTVALLAFAAWGSAAHAFGGTDITVRVSNDAEVINELSVDASTGHNYARGGDGDDGGDGGDATGRNATGGDGGTGGSGGDGGSVMTGNATAIGTIDNDINFNRVFVEGCGCDDSPFPFFFRGGRGGGDDTTVTARNRASVLNALAVDAKTGGNSASAGDGDEGGDGGDASHRSWLRWFNWWQNNGDTTGGNGGNGGSGGAGGSIDTGDAIADGLIVNVVNRNVIRVMPGDDDDDDGGELDI